MAAISLVYRDQFGCSTAKNEGACSNSTRITRQELETRVLNALRNHLMAPELFEEFCEEVTREINQQRIEASSDVAAKQAELERAERGIRKIIDAIKEGYRTPGTKEELCKLEDRKERLTRELAHAEEPPALLHPSMANEYRKRIGGLFEALKDERTRLEASDDIRALIGRIVVSAGEDGKADLWLVGDVAGILTLAAGKNTPARPEDDQVLTSMVAGTCNHSGESGVPYSQLGVPQPDTRIVEAFPLSASNPLPGRRFAGRAGGTFLSQGNSARPLATVRSSLRSLSRR